MILIDFVNEVRHHPFPTQAVVGTVQGVSADLRNTEEPLALVVNASVVSTVNASTLVIQAEQSANGSTSWSVVPGVIPGTLMQLFITSATTQSNLFQSTIGLRSQQYGRINIATVTAGTGAAGWTVGAELLQQKKYIPDDSGGFDVYPGAAMPANAAPVINTPTIGTMTVGVNSSITFNANGLPYPAFAQVGTLPGGVVFNPANHSLVGTPTMGTNGTYNETITATNYLGSGTQAFTLTVAI